MAPLNRRRLPGEWTVRWVASGRLRGSWPGSGVAPGCLGCLGCWWPGRPGRALLRRFGPRLGCTGPRLDRATELLERRGWPALASGRTTPGLRTVTVVAAASSGIRAGRALPALVLGSSVFLQAHLALGYALGPAAREVLEQARLPVLVAAAALAVVAILLLVRRTPTTRVLAEGACPACLALGLVGGRAEPTRSGAESPGGGA
jgi:hypothetical protein